MECDQVGRHKGVHHLGGAAKGFDAGRGGILAFEDESDPSQGRCRVHPGKRSGLSAMR
jgi:hypothetical protein